MRIVQKGIMPDGTKIRIEDWSEDCNCWLPCAHIGAYPIAKSYRQRHNDWLFPKLGHTFRLGFDFKDMILAAEAFDALVSGKKQLRDYAKEADNPELLECL